MVERDENIFDIHTRGTSILLCVKERDNVVLQQKVYYADLWGSRGRKIQHTFGDRCPNYRMVRTATDIHRTIFFVPSSQST